VFIQWPPVHEVITYKHVLAKGCYRKDFKQIYANVRWFKVLTATNEECYFL